MNFASPAPTRSSILAMRMLTFWVRIISGIAIAKPHAVVRSAMLMSSANADGSTLSAVANVLNAPIIPNTVPNKPIIGADLITVETQFRRYSMSLMTSRWKRSMTNDRAFL